MTGGRAAVVTALVVLVAACSNGGDPEPVDLIAEIDEGEDLATTTDLLLDETADDPEVATPDGRAAALADEIAESVELAGELLPEDPAAFEEAAGGSPTSRFVLIGSTLGYTRAALDRIEDDGGDPVATVAFALRLGWDLGDRLEPGGDGFGWVVDDPDALSSADRDEVTGLLAEGADVDAARRLLDVVDPLSGAAVVDVTATELASIVPVTNELDLLTTFQTSFDVAADPDGA